MKFVAFYALVLLSSFAAGCSMKTDCEKIVEHIVTVASKDPAVPKDKREALSALKSRQAILDKCYEDFRPEGGIECVLRATTLSQINACKAKMKKEER